MWVERLDPRRRLADEVCEREAMAEEAARAAVYKVGGFEGAAAAMRALGRNHRVQIIKLRAQLAVL